MDGWERRNTHKTKLTPPQYGKVAESTRKLDMDLEAFEAEVARGGLRGDPSVEAQAALNAAKEWEAKYGEDVRSWAEPRLVSHKPPAKKAAAAPAVAAPLVRRPVERKAAGRKEAKSKTASQTPLPVAAAAAAVVASAHGSSASGTPMEVSVTPVLPADFKGRVQSHTVFAADGRIIIPKGAILPELTDWCSCRNPSYGEMVGCDDEECATEWFHTGCVGLPEDFEGDWVCPDCTARRAGA